MRKTLLGAIGVAAALLAGCNDGTTAAPGAADGNTTTVRFVVLQTPDGKPVDIVGVNDRQKKYATGLKPGTVSDYIRVPTGVVPVGSDGKTLANPLDEGDSKNPRNTLVLGTGTNGPEAYFFPEKDGNIELSGKALPGQYATLVSIGFGLSKDAQDNTPLVLGGADGKCVASVNPNADGDNTWNSVGPGGAPVIFAADPGALALTWYGESACSDAKTATVKTTVKGGGSAYIFPWLSDATQLRVIFIPITTDAPGIAGVIQTAALTGTDEPTGTSDAPGN
jgi:hypothetical protein